MSHIVAFLNEADAPQVSPGVFCHGTESAIWQFKISGDPDECNIRIEGSLDGAGWSAIRAINGQMYPAGTFDLTNYVDSQGEMLSAPGFEYKNLVYIRVVLDSFVGGTDPKVTVLFSGSDFS